ncbi:sigma factor-like helix-turn-helix DNA-binding protein [Actinokineospora cianjurensis]|uniref:Sigma-70-like protein n=1 Tax=Actinokineospora cianjurensis TaxID=585224 RepID=A0A421B572_9PSEU|nr:sigma factor-like helix-turn-helix DNA-binding protein [Actinokineospora cianjurensis]RLK59602.1 sigma-70-like protein [Actinokineospora cianjurensis]
MSGESALGVRPRTWLDAFPWLLGVAQREHVRWGAAIAESDAPERQRRLHQVVDLAMDRLTRWTVGQIFPALVPDFDLHLLELPTRAKNVLTRRGHATTGGLIALSLDDMFEWRGVGSGTITAILHELAELSLSGKVVVPPQKTAEPIHRSEKSDQGTLHSVWLRSVADSIARIATWQTAIGRPTEPIMGGHSAAGVPDEVVKASQRLEALTAEEILAGSALGRDAAELLDDAFRELDIRDVLVLRRRLFADEPATLDELGAHLGITRERVRQIESRARTTMLNRLSVGSLNMVAGSARTMIGTIRPLSDLLVHLPVLAQMVESVDQPAWRVIDRLDDAYEIEDGWCVVPTLSAAKELTRTHLGEHADQYGVALLEDLDLVTTTAPEQQAEFTRAWLSACDYVVDGNQVITRTRSMGDYAAAILSIHGAPMSADEVASRFTVERGARSLRNAMSLDDRFERVDRDRWALAEWGMEAYAGVRSVIREELAKAGGRINLDALIERITGRYSVAASSVITYASAPPFKTLNGVVRLQDASRESRKTPERTNRMYRRSDAWVYRVCITHDHLRGSGSVAPKAIVSILGMQFGEKRQLDSALGPLAVNYCGTQPTFGSIRRFLREDDIPIGTEVFLVIGDDNSFAVQVVAGLRDEPLADALALVGAPTALTGDAARRFFASAINLSTGATVLEVISAFRERGDTEIADLLTSVRQSLETGEPARRHHRALNVDDILELL